MTRYSNTPSQQRPPPPSHFPHQPTYAIDGNASTIPRVFQHIQPQPEIGRVNHHSHGRHPSTFPRAPDPTQPLAPPQDYFGGGFTLGVPGPSHSLGQSSSYGGPPHGESMASYTLVPS